MQNIKINIVYCMNLLEIKNFHTNLFKNVVIFPLFLIKRESTLEKNYESSLTISRLAEINPLFHYWLRSLGKGLII